MQIKRLVSFFLFFCYCNSGQAVTINLDTIPALSDPETSVHGYPFLTSDSCHKGTMFNGINDQLLIRKSPLANAEQFTVQAVIFPMDSILNSPQPRLIHLEDPAKPEQRITLELRLSEENNWYFDAFISSERGSVTLKSAALLHPLNQWHHIAVTYKNHNFTTYVNGIKELSAQVPYTPLSSEAMISVGARMNLKYWYKGIISMLSFKTTALSPDHFSINTNCKQKEDNFEN